MNVEKDEANEEHNTTEHTIKIILILETLNKYSNLIVGIATVLLVFVTGIYIALSMKIANETKRLADLTVEQFKIKSYPTFLIVRGKPTYEDGKYKDEIEIQNHGEISSFKTTIAIFFGVIVETDEGGTDLNFLLDWQSYYIDDDLGKLSALDYSNNIRSLSLKKITTDRILPKEILDQIKYQIVIIRHKVPYDTLYSYEVFTYGLKKKKKDENSEQITLLWHPLPDNKKNELIKKIFTKQVIAPEREDKVNEFFVDFPDAKPINFF